MDSNLRYSGRRNYFFGLVPFDPPQFSFRNRNRLLHPRYRWFESILRQQRGPLRTRLPRARMILNCFGLQGHGAARPPASAMIDAGDPVGAETGGDVTPFSDNPDIRKRFGIKQDTARQTTVSS